MQGFVVLHNDNLGSACENRPPVPLPVVVKEPDGISTLVLWQDPSFIFNDRFYAIR